MAFMKSCCCFSNMKSACLATGIYTIVMAALGLIGLIFQLSSRYNYYYTSLWSLVGVGIIYVLLLIAGILLVTGSRKGYHGRSSIMGFIVIDIIYIVLCVIALGVVSWLLSLVHVQSLITSLQITIFIALGIYITQLIFFVLGMLCAISLYQQLGEEGPNGPLTLRSTQQHVTMVTNQTGGFYPGTVQIPYPTGYYSTESYPPSYTSGENKTPLQ